VSLAIPITGMGVCTALGHSPSELVARYKAGEVAVREVPWTEATPDDYDWWAPIVDFDPSWCMDEKVIEGTAPFAQFAMSAMVSALKVAGLDELDPIRTAIVLGTTIGGATSMERAQYDVDVGGPDAADPKVYIRAWPNMAAAQMAMRWGLHGTCLTISTACASSLDAVGIASRLLLAGAADVALVGGTESVLGVGVGENGFVPGTGYVRRGYRMSADTDDPRRACQPFDRHRGGMVMGEGAGMMILERPDHARARGAAPYALVEGYGSLSDGYHPSSPDPTGQWERRAMELALAEAGVQPAAIDAIAAHGTGTPKGDVAEIRAINELFAGRSEPVPAMSVKGVLGHPAGASGAISLIAAVHGMGEGELLHTAGTTEVDPEVQFEVVTGRPKALDIDFLQVNAFGFGGQNASVVLRSARE
jgi:3-oxoacyl-[acyl-carrier-protein] synthase II